MSKWVKVLVVITFIIFIINLGILSLFVSSVYYISESPANEAISEDQFVNSQNIIEYVDTRFIQSSHFDSDYYYDSSADTLCIQDVDYFLNISGNSMTPTIFDGNIVIGTEYNPSVHELKEGMMIGYYHYSDSLNKTRKIFHRISATYPEYVLTESDRYGNYQRVSYEDIRYIAIGALYT